jgi:hypothetical protein
VLSFVVPVFPAAGTAPGSVRRTSAAVPSGQSTTSRIMSRAINATSESSAGIGATAPAPHTVRPTRSSIRPITRGATTEPALSNAVYAATNSIGRTADAPIAVAGTSSIGVVTPSRRASAMTLSSPTRSPNCTATSLRDRTNASRIVIAPKNFPSAFSGRYTSPFGSGIANTVSYTTAFPGMLSANAAA